MRLFMSEPPAQPHPQSASYTPAYRTYVLTVLLLTYVVNVMDRGVLALLLEGIRKEFELTDGQLGFLASLPFAFFYSTLGIPIAAIADRTIRRNVLATCCALWSAATAACGLAFNFGSLVVGRALTAIGEAGGTPPSHSLISDYFSRARRATALSIYALGVPIGTMLGNLLGGWGNHFYGWRMTFVLIGAPGLLVALLVWLTVREPPRGLSELGATKPLEKAPPLWEVVKFLASYASFRHMCLAAGLHSVVWYAGSQLNGVFFMRSHGMTSGEAGSWLAMFAGVGALGTLLGGLLSDRICHAHGRSPLVHVGARHRDARDGAVPVLRRISRTICRIVIPSFCVMISLASMFFGPSFAVSQTLATLRSRAVATSLLLARADVRGTGPRTAGRRSDQRSACADVRAWKNPSATACASWGS